MKARAFDYPRADSVEAALAAHAACDGEARYLAGGQSLLPALNLRLDAPDLLIDIAHIPALRGIARDGADLRIGALTRHSEILHDPLVGAHAPLLAQAGSFVAHPAIRNRGTMGGSLALADPASEFPACMLALEARIEIAGAGGLRSVPADAFFRDLYETALEPGEMVHAVRVPVTGDRRVRFDELARRRGDYALVGLAASAAFAGAEVSAIRLAFCSVGPTPMRAPSAEAALAGWPLDAERIAAAKAALADDLQPDDDGEMPGATRLHLARVLLGRTLLTLSRRGGPAMSVEMSAEMGAGVEARPVALTVNGARVRRFVEPRLSLADFLRQDLGLVGTKLGCESGSCGACLVRLDGAVVHACLMLAVQADGARVDTIEGLSDSGALAELQAAFHARNALQCGFCTAGVLMTAQACLDAGTVERDAIRDALSGNYCRCTGYEAIVDAIEGVARARMDAGGGT